MTKEALTIAEDGNKARSNVEQSHIDTRKHHTKLCKRCVERYECDPSASDTFTNSSVSTQVVRKNILSSSMDSHEIAKKARELYGLCDVEHKGFITKGEMQRIGHYLPLTEQQLQNVFDTLDEDGNGYLTLAEFTGGFGYFIGAPNHAASHEDENAFEENNEDVSTYALEESDTDIEEVQFQQAMENLDVEAVQAFINSENSSEGSAGSMTALRELWSNMRRNNPELLPNLEQLLMRFGNELSKTQSEAKKLEYALRNKVASHEEEVRRLETEMEHQIRCERERLRNEERAREKQLRADLERELHTKEQAYQEMLRQKEEMRARLEFLNSSHADTMEENDRLAKEKEQLEEQLEETQCSLQESQNYIEDLNRKYKEDRRKRAKAAIEISEGIAIEREGLVRQLDHLRLTNKKLKDMREETFINDAFGYSQDGSAEVVHFYEKHKCGGADSNHTVAPVEKSPVHEEEQEETLADILRAKPDDEEECEFDDYTLTQPTYTPGSAAVYETFEEYEPIRARNPIREEPDGGYDHAVLDKSRIPERVFKVVFVGDSGVGKSSIIHRFCHESFQNNFSATIGIDFQIKTIIVDDSAIALQIWDTAGQERFRSITKQYFRRADGVIVVYDVTNEQTFLNVRKWVGDVVESADQGVIKMIVANKIDLLNDNETNDEISKSGKQLAKQYDALFHLVSAKSGKSVTEIFHAMASVLREREDKDMRNALNITANVESNKKKGCCGGGGENKSSK